MDWKSIGKALGTSAPVIGTLLGGPAGGAVGALVASALGTSNDPDSVSAALAASPDALAKVQELQINAKVQLQQLTVQAEQNRLQAESAQFASEVADRDSARQLAAKQPNDFVRPLIAMVLLLGGLGMVVAVFTGFSESVMTNTTAAVTLGTLMGFWFNELKQVMSFYFGSTKDSSKQTNDITKFAVSPDMIVSKDQK